MTDLRHDASAAVDGERAAPEGDWSVTQDREDAPVARTGRGVVFWLFGQVRRLWRWLTSMRTALILLFLLAVAAIPGSLLPQTTINTDIGVVQQYFVTHPKLAPLLNDLGMFSVFSSAWFSAIYLLLFISLVGCLFPRLRVYYTALRRVPPDAPSRLHRMPVNAADLLVDGAPEAVGARLRQVLRSRRYRTVVRSHPDGSVTVSAEKGYLKEAGNLLFHFSLIAVLLGVAFGSWYGWQGDRILVAGSDTAFCNTASQLDDLHLGARMTAAKLEPFCLTLNGFDAKYTSAGEPIVYAAQASYSLGSSTAWTPVTIKVNEPLRLHNANVYLLGHGYAPIVKFTDKFGHSETKVAAFATDGDLGDTSDGAIAFPDSNIDPATGSNTDPKTFVKHQIGFSGVYLPTATADGSATSAFPAENNPELFLTAYVGDLGLDNGVPQSVYMLDEKQIASGALTVLKPAVNPAQPIRLKPGQSAKLSDGSTVQFLGTRQWISLSVRDNPGEKLVLVGAILLVVGLVGSLTGRRRRVWFRAVPAEVGSSVTAGGLARAEYASFPAEFDSIVKAAQQERNARGNALP